MKVLRRLLTIALVASLLLTNGGMVALAEAVLKLPAGLLIVEEGAFEGDTSISKVKLGDKVEEIRARAFADSSLEEINLPDSLKVIDDTAFDGPDKVSVTANEGTYAYDWAVEKGYVEDKNNAGTPGLKIEDNIVAGYEGTATDVVIPYGITEIKAFAFSLKNIHSIKIPESVTNIGDYAFYACRNLDNVSMADGITYIGDCAFELCDNLTSIFIPDTVKHIGVNAFERCPKLENVKLSKNLTYLGAAAFTSCSALTSITIPEGVTNIGAYTFNQCGKLNNIIIPNTVKTIGNYAFNSCYSLTNLTLPNSVTYIGDDAFKECTSLKRIIIPEYVTYLGKEAFLNCRALTKVFMPESVNSIGNKTFSYCNKLIAYVFADSYAEQYCIDNNIYYEYISTQKQNAIKSPTEGTAIDIFTSGQLNITFDRTDGATSYRVTLTTEGIEVFNRTYSDYGDEDTMTVHVTLYDMPYFTPDKRLNDMSVTISVTAIIPD